MFYNMLLLTMHFIVHGYDTFLGEIRAQWAAIGPFFADMSGFMALYFGNHVNVRRPECIIEARS